MGLVVAIHLAQCLECASFCRNRYLAAARAANANDDGPNVGANDVNCALGARLK